MHAFQVFLIAHIAGGTTALATGTLILAARKGDRKHRILGKVFALSMLLTGVCSLVLSILHPNDFLFSVGLFSIYLTATGWLHLRPEGHVAGLRREWVHGILLAGLVVGSAHLARVGIAKTMVRDTFAWVDFAFAGGGFLFAWQDFRRRASRTRTGRLAFHLQRMTGAYISALTAFLVVNARGRYSIWPWLLPTLVLTPLILKWSRRYRTGA
jgi:uncharacterized membrane protein